MPDFSVAHLTDLHATTPTPAWPVKRALSWLAWRVGRRAVHRAEVLEAALADLRSLAPDQLAVTGDLTNAACEGEFAEARRWLERLGPPGRVTAVPGNHDALVPVGFARSWALWSDYLVSDAAAAPPDAVFPSLRVRGPVAFVGVSSARPSAPLWATGSLGHAQLGRLDRLLADLAARDLFRVVLVHHTPLDALEPARRRLVDAEPLRHLLRRHGADLVLHGHLHRSHVDALEGPRGAIPVVCAPSVSDARTRRGGYHLYEVSRVANGFAVRLRRRLWDADEQRFREGADAVLLG